MRRGWLGWLGFVGGGKGGGVCGDLDKRDAEVGWVGRSRWIVRRVE